MLVTWPAWGSTRITRNRKKGQKFTPSEREKPNISTPAFHDLIPLFLGLADTPAKVTSKVRAWLTSPGSCHVLEGLKGEEKGKR